MVCNPSFLIELHKRVDCQSCANILHVVVVIFLDAWASPAPTPVSSLVSQSHLQIFKRELRELNRKPHRTQFPEHWTQNPTKCKTLLNANPTDHRTLPNANLRQVQIPTEHKTLQPTARKTLQIAKAYQTQNPTERKSLLNSEHRTLPNAKPYLVWWSTFINLKKKLIRSFFPCPFFIPWGSGVCTL